MKRIFKILTVSALFLLLSSCTNCSSVFEGRTWRGVFSKDRPIYFVSYNTQTFFDAIQDGNEFSQFKGPKSKWNAEKYKTRLSRLREAGEVSVQAMGGKPKTMPDIFVLQEVESERVLEDFSKLFSKSDGYSNVLFFQPEPAMSFSTAVFSKFPIVDYQQFRLEDSRFNCVALRPLVKLSVEIDLGRKCEYLTVFAVHWKSKKGNHTALIRQAQEQQVVREVKALLAEDPNANIIICGDFNQRLEEFSGLAAFGNAWQISAPRYMDFGLDGSYFYRDEWEAIDHIFFSKALKNDDGLELVDFAPIAVEPLIKEDGKPNLFQVYNGKGYSDHLPICAVLDFPFDE